MNGIREARTPDLRITRVVVRLDHTGYETCALANCAMVPIGMIRVDDPLGLCDLPPVILWMNCKIVLR